MIDPARIREILDDYPVDIEAIFAELSVEDWAAAYCRYFARVMATEERIGWDGDPDGWAAHLYSEAEFSRSWTQLGEERLRAFLRLIVAGAANDEVLGFIGAGPFEDFLFEDESRLAWMEEQAAASARFRKALGNVYVWSWASEETFLRLEAAAQTQLSWAPSYGPRPGTRELSRPTPEEAAAAWFFPRRTEAIGVGSRIEGDQARVWLLTRERPVLGVIVSDGDTPKRFDNTGN